MTKHLDWKKAVREKGFSSIKEMLISETETMGGTVKVARHYGVSEQTIRNRRRNKWVTGQGSGGPRFHPPAKQRSGKTCIDCGKDPWPNMFRCQKCLSKISEGLRYVRKQMG